MTWPQFLLIHSLATKFSSILNNKGPFHICVHLTSCSASNLSRIFRHWMRLCSTMKTSPSDCAATPPSTPIIQHGAGWNNDFGVRRPGQVLVVLGWRCFTMFAQPWVRQWLYERRSLNSILSCPMFGSSVVNGSSEKGRLAVR